MSNIPLMVGYVESWEKLSLTEAAQAGYTCILLAFGSIDGTTVEIYENSFPPDNSQNGTVDQETLQNDIQGALEAGAQQVLISFGGANNTYNPGNASADDVAAAIVSFVQGAGFTGCDFDLEVSLGGGSYLQDLLQAIRDSDGTLLLTAAPQLNDINGDGDVQFVTSGFDTDYNDAIEAGLFDYLFPQAYCTGSFSIPGTDYTEDDVEFISAAFTYIFANLVPASTMVAIGEPADSDAAGCSANIYESNSPPSYDEIADQYQSIAD